MVGHNDARAPTFKFTQRCRKTNQRVLPGLLRFLNDRVTARLHQSTTPTASTQRQHAGRTQKNVKSLRQQK
jgi:hypothetical protein